MLDPEELNDSYRQSLRELWIILGVLAVFATWNFATGAWLSGMPEDNTDPVPTWLGMPRWVVVTVLAPWAVGNVVIVWFSLRGMRDTELGDEFSDESVIAGSQDD